MNDMSAVIVPKSDQINSDDLIAGPRTIRIRDVTIRPGTEQPVSIFFDGDNNKPWKPCKSASRVLVAAWGPDANLYRGRSATIYRDDAVTWGGMKVGGIRISALSDLKQPLVMALTEKKGSKKIATIQPLKVETAAPTIADATATGLTFEQAQADVTGAATLSELETVWKRRSMAPHRAKLQDLLDKRKDDLAPNGRADTGHGDQFDGDRITDELVDGFAS